MSKSECVDVRSIRMFNGLKQNEMAQKLGISATYLCDIEAGRRRVTEDLRKKIAMVFGVSDELIEALKRSKLSDRLIV
jgi:transcriptional regulator with XRE-family HTH domain